jgi:hypothetical protein
LSRAAVRKARTRPLGVVLHDGRLRVAWDANGDMSLAWALDAVRDAGADASRWTSVRLRRSTLLLEEERTRQHWQLRREPLAGADGFDRFALEPLAAREAAALATLANPAVRVPLEVVGEGADALTGLDWTELEWEEAGVAVRGRRFAWRTLRWVPNRPA